MGVNMLELIELWMKRPRLAQRYNDLQLC